MAIPLDSYRDLLKNKYYLHMKKIMCVLCLLLVLGCKSKKRLTENNEAIPKEIVTLEKLSISEVDKNQKNKAYELGKRVLMTCNTSKFKPFNESEATPSVIKNTTQSRLTKTCLKFRLRYGEFKDLKLIEIFKNKTNYKNKNQTGDVFWYFPGCEGLLF